MLGGYFCLESVSSAKKQYQLFYFIIECPHDDDAAASTDQGI